MTSNSNSNQKLFRRRRNNHKKEQKCIQKRRMKVSRDNVTRNVLCKLYITSVQKQKKEAKKSVPTLLVLSETKPQRISETHCDIVVEMCLDHESNYNDYVQLSELQQDVFINIAVENVAAYLVLLTMLGREQQSVLNIILEHPVEDQIAQIKELEIVDIHPFFGCGRVN